MVKQTGSKKMAAKAREALARQATQEVAERLYAGGFERLEGHYTLPCSPRACFVAFYLTSDEWNCTPFVRVNPNLPLEAQHFGVRAISTALRTWGYQVLDCLDYSGLPIVFLPLEQFAAE